MNKFVYEKDDVCIAKTQCEFCTYNIKENPNRCEKYEEKPAEIIHNKIKCPLLKDTLPTPW